MRQHCHHRILGKQRTSWPTLETPAVRERNPEVSNLVIVPLRGDLVMAGYTRPRGGSKPKSNMRAFRKLTLWSASRKLSPRVLSPPIGRRYKHYLFPPQRAPLGRYQRFLLLGFRRRRVAPRFPIQLCPGAISDRIGFRRTARAWIAQAQEGLTGFRQQKGRFERPFFHPTINDGNRWDSRGCSDDDDGGDDGCNADCNRCCGQSHCRPGRPKPHRRPRR